MEETSQVGEVLTEETPQAAEILTDETPQTGEILMDEASQTGEAQMDEASQTAAGRFSLRDAVPFALVILVTVAVIAFIVAAPSAHAETTTAQGNEYIQQTVEYVDGSATLYPAVIAAGASISLTQAGEVSSWNPAKVQNDIDYKVTVKNSGFNSPAYFRTVIALECTPDGEALTFLNANTADFAWSKVDGAIEVNGTKYAVYVAVYEGSTEGLGQGQLGSDSDVNVVSQVAMRSSVGNSQVATLGEDYSIMVVTQAVQAEDFKAVTDDYGNVTKSAAAAALDTAFGEITATNHPWSDKSSRSEQSETASASTTEQ